MYNSKKLIKESKWDSDIFSKKVGIINLGKKLSELDIEELKKESNEYDLIVMKDLTTNFENSEAISKRLNGFIVDLNVQFSKKVSVNKISDSSRIKNKSILNSEDKKKIITIASNAFKNSRFYSDQNIEKGIANKIFENWIGNSFENDDKRIIIHKENNEVLGFLLFSINELQEEIIIELIAVDSNVTSKGIGKKLINDFESSFSSEKYEKYLFKVGTQVNNVTAMNFYIKNNYKIQSEARTYHIWNRQNF